MRAKPLVPEFHRVATRWKISKHVMAGTIGQRIVGRVGHIPPTFHPVMSVASNFDCLRLCDCHPYLLLESRLSDVQRRIDGRQRVDVVQNPIRIEYHDGATCRKDGYVRYILTALLV